jgi:hypothetical protein
MIEVKAHDVVLKTFQLLQQAAGTDPDSVILKTEGGIRYKAWDLTACVVDAILLHNGATVPLFAGVQVATPSNGMVVVQLGPQGTAVDFSDGEQYRDASLEFQVTRSSGTVETVPAGGYIPVRIYRDLDGA